MSSQTSALLSNRIIRRHTRRLVIAMTMVSSMSWAESRQDGEDPDDKENKAEAPERPGDMPLAVLPEPPSFRLDNPRPRALEAIDRLLTEVTSQDHTVRQRASRTILEAKTDWVSGVARRVDQIAERADKTAMKTLLGAARDKARSAPSPNGGDDADDYLQILIAQAEPQSPVWRDLTQLLALERMLTAIGTTDAAREIIRIYVRFGEFIRIDCQHQLEALGDRAIAALIETQRHQAPAIGEWATKRLKLRDKLNPDDAVRTKDPTALADTLVALGKNGDPDSAQILISFAGTEQAQVRVAARQGIALLGEVASWQLRDAYLSATGRRPPRDWTWNRTARELFTELDRLRLEEIYKLYGEASEAQKAGDLAKMREGYDKILTLNPSFEKRDEMAPGYVAYADSVADTDLPAALLALRRAERIDPSDDSRKRITSKRLLLEAKGLRADGLIDSTLLDRAAELDPSNREASAILKTPSGGVDVWGARSRYFVAGAVSFIALLGAGWIMLSSLRRRPEARRNSTVPSPANPPKTGEKDEIPVSTAARPTNREQSQSDEIAPSGDASPDDASSDEVSPDPNAASHRGDTTSAEQTSAPGALADKDDATNSGNATSDETKSHNLK